MDTKEEVLEEIEEFEDVSSENKDEKNTTDAEELVMENDDEVSSKTPDTIPVRKNKVPIVILLSILLVLDIIALVIYIVGIEKVISFIK